ncbi:MAG: endonuclease MutS2 [Peptoniphilus sp.]|nr:endonuclease MutS2 [Peptoniphilus sp.]MDD7362524.1 endonuclease MutS2 [Bacillota bacterium]MDY6045077.1 endonuclease MutS2 [Peptoniphilus sp.]
MAPKIEAVLGFDDIVDKLKALTESRIGEARVDAMRFSTDAEEILYMQRETEEAFKLLVTRSAPPLTGARPVAKSAHYASRGGVLHIAEILEIGDSLRGVLRMQKYMAQTDDEVEDPYPIVRGLVSSLWTKGDLREKIEATIESEDSIYDDATPELKQIRRSLGRKKDQVRERLQRILNSQDLQESLQDLLVTMREGRYVVPVRHDARNKVKGLVHDMSASGQTVYIEPMAVVEINNEIRELELKERDEIQRILEELSEEIGEYADAFSSNEEIFAKLDFIFAKAKLASDQNAIQPALSTERVTKLVNARHPLIDPKVVVPLSLDVGGENRGLIITGPNTGGKTVSLKTLGLMVLMTQYGLHIPADRGTAIGIYGGVYADIGDEQSIEQSLSTFSGHMVNIIHILENADQNSLLLFDELGAGTDPTEGAALALSIIEHCIAEGMTFMATTHYTQLKLYALTREGVQNASMEFDIDTLSPTYRLHVGIPGKSNAFEISKRLGLPEAILDGAQHFLDRKDIAFEDVLKTLEAERGRLEKREAELVQLRGEYTEEMRRAKKKTDTLENERDRILERARDEARRILKSAKEDADLAVSEIKELKDQLEREDAKTLQEAQDVLREGQKKFKEKDRGIVLKKAKNPAKKLKPGDTVYAESLGVEATVLEKPDEKGNVYVQAGLMKMTLPAASLVRKERIDTARGRVHTNKVSQKKSKHAKVEYDIRGKTFEESEPILEKALDDAYLASLDHIRIIHGKGTGMLRKKVKEYLRTHPSVKKQEDADPSEGGSGVTIAYLR